MVQCPVPQAGLTMVLGAILTRGRDVCKRNGLLILSVLSVIVGCLLGFFLRTRHLSPQEINYFQFPGELLMRMLKMLILPLVVSRNMFPANLVEATFKQYRTKTTPIVHSPTLASEVSPRRILIYSLQEDNGSRVQNFALDLTPPPEVVYKSEPGTSDGMNVLGIVIFSATMGIMLGRMGDSGTPLVSFCQCLNESVMKIVAVAVWYFPFGIVFLIAGKILEMDDPTAVRKKLGFYAITVVCGLMIHGLFILPLLYFFITKKNPIVFIRGILQALLIALATSSSSATLPITFKCLLENNHIDRRIARFVLPVGATINMDGTALYEAVATIFIAQVNNYELDFGQIITISITATAASIGAAGIPQAGLVTMVIVLTSVGLPTDDITLIIAVDWALDRFRTMINVLGDALAAGIMAHICRKDFAQDMGTQVRQCLPCSLAAEGQDRASEPPGDHGDPAEQLCEERG
ncbi:PREDICTED: excitatory amino acid transporter 5 isoform X3 [Condylura cristata]|uniref:excitatory amino acid transporter 5 isoform X3 n=1 Tax=Condylura cristata TaxID=143302 RepID=UPI000642B4AB|nr:PREDICTED: excitatory amino acid transporter 5 isoform X3 [Condylura cristata]